MPAVQSLDHLVLTIRDLDRTLSFYSKVLGMRATSSVPSDGSTRWALSFGVQKINLHVTGAEFDPKAQTPTTGSADLCFLSDTLVAEWQAHLETHAIEVIEGPVQRTGTTGPILSIYLRDPDGNLIEIANAL